MQYFRITPQQCEAMKQLELGQKCVALEEYGIITDSQRKGLSNRVCYGSDSNGQKLDDTGCDSCGALKEPNWMTPL